MGICCPRVVPRQPETARATSVLPAATGVVRISFYVGRLFVRVVCGFQAASTVRNAWATSAHPTCCIGFLRNRYCVQQFYYALSISFAVLNSLIMGKVGRVFAHKVCGFQAALRLIRRVGTCCPRVIPRQPETARATSVLPAATGVACISFYVGRLFVRVVCGFRLPQRCGTRGQRVPTLLPTSVFYATGIVCNSSMYALFISFAVLNSRMVDKVGRVSTHKVCGFQAALRLICRVGTCCPRVIPRQPETARATSVLPAATGVACISFYVSRLFARVVCVFRLPQRCGTRGQQVPTLLPHRFSTQPALKGGGNGGGCVIGVMVV